MAYGMEQLRKAGQAMRNFDDAYAKKVRGMYDKAPAAIAVPGQVMSGTPIMHKPQISSKEQMRQPGYTQGVPKDREPTAGEMFRHQAIEGTMAVGVMGANFASRYALPAGGVTLAGKALYDLTTSFGGAADQQEPGQLPM